jgi:RNA polymerase sigma-70 factor (ECF subfamily)
VRVREISLDPTFDRGDASPSVSDQVGDTDLLSRAFDRLDADKRSILVLHHLEHLPLASIAAALGIPVGTLKWRLSDARRALARALVAEGEARR